MRMRTSSSKPATSAVRSAYRSSEFRVDQNRDALNKFVVDVCGWKVDGDVIRVPTNKENEARSEVRCCRPRRRCGCGRVPRNRPRRRSGRRTGHPSSGWTFSLCLALLPTSTQPFPTTSEAQSASQTSDFVESVLDGDADADEFLETGHVGGQVGVQVIRVQGGPELGVLSAAVTRSTSSSSMSAAGRSMATSSACLPTRRTKMKLFESTRRRKFKIELPQ
jgi:hypothetical protein